MKMILGISIQKVEAEIGKLDEMARLTINSVPRIKDIEVRDMPAIGLKNALVASYEFETSYEPKIGKIKIEGEVLCREENAKQISDDWKKSKKIPDEIAIPILNTVFRRCVLKVMNEAEDLQLPPPIRLPTVSADASKDQKKK